MTELLRLANIGSKGLATDQQPWELPPEFITYGKNFKITAGAIETSKGFNQWSKVGTNFNPAHIIYNDHGWVVAGLTAVNSFNGSNWVDISSTGGYGTLSSGDEFLWSSALLGGITVLNNPQHHPEYWNGHTANMLPLPFSATHADFTAAAIRGQVIRSHKNFLFLLNLTEGGVEQKDSYRWSHPADINGIPPSWDETDQSFLAGKAALGGDGGAIIDGRSLRDSFVIYSENSIDVLHFTGDEFVWKRKELSSTLGVLAQNCVVEVKGKHFILSDGDIVINDGTNIKSIAHNRIRRQINSRISHDKYDKSYVVRNNIDKEIWFCFPEEGEDFANIAAIYNWADDNWSMRDLPQDINIAAYGSRLQPPKTWDSIPDDNSWDSQDGIWAESGSTPLDDNIIGINTVEGSLFILDSNETPDEPVDFLIERTDYPLVDGRQVTTITRVYPHISGNTPVFIQIGSQYRAGGDIHWKPPLSFDPSTDRKIDLRTTGEYHCWRVYSVSKNNFLISGMDFEFEAAGIR